MIRDRDRRFKERERQDKIKQSERSDQRLKKQSRIPRTGWPERRRRLTCTQKIEEDPS